MYFVLPVQGLVMKVCFHSIYFCKNASPELVVQLLRKEGCFDNLVNSMHEVSLAS